MESQINTGGILGCVFFIHVSSLIEIGINNQGLGSNRAWGVWFFWERKLDSINLQRYGMVEKYFLIEDMEILDPYNVMIGASLWSIILSSFFSFQESIGIHLCCYNDTEQFAEPW